MRRLMRACSCAFAVVAVGLFIPVETNAQSTRTIEELTADWWQWVFSIPADENPSFDGNCGARQTDRTWFLAGTFSGGPITRECTISGPSRSILIPLANLEADNLVCFIPDLTCSVEDLRAITDKVIDSVTNLSLEIDGVPVPAGTIQRVESPVFSYNLPKDNIFAGACSDALPGRYGPAVSEGYWALVGPLSKGEHTVHWTSTSADVVLTPEEFPSCGLTQPFVVFGLSVDMTYDLTVTGSKP